MNVSFLLRFGAKFSLFLALLSLGQLTHAQTVKVHESFAIQGFSQPSKISKVASSLSGIVHTHGVVEGQMVRKGDCLVKLNQKSHNARVELARIAKDSSGELQIANAELAAKQSRLSRIEALLERNHATSVEVLQAKEDLGIAKASVRRAMDRLAQQQADFDRLVAEADEYCIKAPFDGIVLEMTKQVGEFVGPGEPSVCTIVDLSNLSVQFLVPRSQLGTLKVGSRVQVLFSVSNQRVPGVIEYVSPFPNGETNTYMVKTRVENPELELDAGERCLLQKDVIGKTVGHRKYPAPTDDSAENP